MTNEMVVLVDEDDREVGTGEKLAVHRSGLLHRAFSIFVVDDEGRLLLQRRAAVKYHSAGLWSNTCCGHPRPGETVLAASTRRLREEMGFECPLRPAFSFVYRAALDHGLTEHELDHVLTGSYAGVPRPNPDEVDEWRAVPVEQLRSDLAAQPRRYSVWLQPALEGLFSRGLMPIGGRGQGGIVTAERTRTEEHKIPGDKLLSRIKELVHQGNIRRVSIKNDEGQILLEIPLTLGVVGMALMPVWIAIGAMAAYAANYTIVVEKTDK